MMKEQSPKMHPAAALRFHKGFTMMEILVSMMILALLAAGFFSVAVSGRNLTWRSRMRFLASEIARHRLEELRFHVRADTWSNTSNPLYPTGTWSTWVAAPENSLFQTRRFVGTMGTFQCRNVTVQVRWNESGI
ncbi:MAG: type II secretion system protein [Candidatus Omnitrophota bacterium]